jgi:PIN domain nuclease of toxin-antitoxin system
MRLLLDTHVLLWWMFEHPRLTPDLKSLVADESNTILVSGVSAFEISTKQALGKLDAPDDLDGQVEASGFTALPLTIRHGLAAGRLPLHHRDPFDRLLVAQAQCDDLTLVTADRKLLAYDVRRIMVN